METPQIEYMFGPAPEERKNYSAAQRKTMAKNGQALPDGSFPIADTEDLQNAISAFGRASNPGAAKAHIIKRARALGATSMLPDAWKAQQKSLDALDEWRRDLALRGLGLYQPNLPPVELRGLEGGTGDGSITVHGHAALYGVTTTLRDNKHVRVTEEIMPGAFDRALSDPERLVHLNFGHDMNRAVASTDVPAGQVGGLELRTDSRGLAYFARLDPEDADARQMAVKLRSGVIRGASYKFHIGDEERTEGETEDGRRSVHYRMHEIHPLFDVCVAAQGATRSATSNLRSYAAMAMLLDGRSDNDSLGHARRTDSVGVADAAQTEGVSGTTAANWEQRAAALKLRLRVNR